MQVFTLGIDPGKKGGLAVFGDKTFSDVQKMPELYTDLLAKLIHTKNCFENVKCYIEQIQFRPAQKGVILMLTNYGRILGYLEALGIPYEVVSPQKWKKHYNLIGKDKADSINLCNQMFGTELTKTQDGIAEAMLIGYYGHTNRK